MIAERIASFQEELRACAATCGRDRAPDIVAVTKTQPAELVAQAIDAGIEQIGENYLQEARVKFASLPPVRKHFIGHIQTNKAKAIVETFDVVQSVDRLEAGAALSRAAAALGRLVPILIQVNISPADRFGVAPEEAERLAEGLRALPGLSLDGVMAIGPLDAARDEILRAFEIAAKTFGRIGGSTLSIGMSGDWREAVGAGTTMLRIGTALFGPRTQR